MKVSVPEIDPMEYRDHMDQVQYNVYSALHQAVDLLEDISDYGDPMHWPDGYLVAATRMRPKLGLDAARESYVAGKYNQALAEAHMATWDVLRMPGIAGS